MGRQHAARVVQQGLRHARFAVEDIKPTEDELVEIAAETANCARIFGVDPKVAFLSYSTYGSGSGADVDKMRNATSKAKEA